MGNDKPAAEVVATPQTLQKMVDAFLPEFREQPIVHIGSGWDNEVYRLGRAHILRMPRREAAAQLIVHEQTWLPKLAEDLPIPVPVPTFCGEPCFGYPWNWSVVPWFEGEMLIRAEFDARDVAEDLSQFLKALNKPAPEDAPTNPFRGLPLAERDQRLRHHAAMIPEGLGAEIVSLWEKLVDTAPWQGPPCWLHGDLHPLNLIVRNRRLAAVIDFGDICCGDPATDLAVAWFVFDASDRKAFREMMSVDDAMWLRAKANALAVATAIAAHSESDPEFRKFSRNTLARVLETDTVQQ